jgi:hypothetical protein
VGAFVLLLWSLSFVQKLLDFDIYNVGDITNGNYRQDENIKRRIFALVSLAL